MKIYWSDREGKPAPSHCTFHVVPFQGAGFSGSVQQVGLPSPSSAKVVKRTYLPTREVWIQNVEEALRLIQRKELQKVVLARACILALDSTPDPFSLAASLKQKAQGAAVFCFQSETGAFLGASPEHLFVRKERQIISEAIAGTRRRGKTKNEDEKLQRQLLTSVKDLREFSPIQTYLQQTLSPFCIEPLQFTPLSVHQTQNVQHLYSRCSGQLKAGAADQEILTQLHPTPALCGTPKTKALSPLQQLDPFDRGLYGGIIGWTTPEASEWVVAIRSCLVQGNIATLFSGAGIVEGSDPEKEWEELNHKLELYDGILDH